MRGNLSLLVASGGFRCARVAKRQRLALHAQGKQALKA